MTQRVAGAAPLTIGELAERTGVAPATLRVWEQRHGFPRPQRLDSGHRRYDETAAELVRYVVRRRDEGVRLETAIAQALSRVDAAAGAASVYAALRRRHPGLPVHRLRKRALIAMSHAIEDDFLAKADRGRLFGAFQEARFWRHARARWSELDRVSEATFVFADVSEAELRAAGDRPVLVPLGPDAALRREWVVVCDAADLPIALAAWEIPGQEELPDRERVFEAVWTLSPLAVRHAARVCAQLAADADRPEGAAALEAMADEPTDEVVTGPAAVALFSRMLAYVAER